MERFEFNSKIEKENEGEVGIEIKKNKSLMNDIRERFPSFEKIYNTGKITFKMVVAIVMFGVGQNLFAQEGQKQTEDPFWNFQNLDKLKNENLSTVYNKIPSSVVSIPEGRKVLGSYMLSGNSKDEPQRIISGEVPNQEGILGDLIVYTDSKTVTKEEEGDQSSIADTASFFVEIGKVEQGDIINKKTEKRTASAFGQTREQALFSAIKSIGETGTISVKNMESTEKQEDEGGLSGERISVLSISGLNYIKGVTIVSEKKLDNGSYEITVEGDVVYNAE